ncbi:MAG: rhomboid family intramembrane serine protease [Planctomycetota bacterium]
MNEYGGNHPSDAIWKDMSYENRDYLREEARRFGGPGSGGSAFRGGVSANLPPMTLWLLIVNVMVFLVDSILSGSMRGDAAAPTRWGRFSVEDGVLGFQLWRVLTYQFLHWDFVHLLFNMVGLWIFGGMIERWWGGRRFLAFYLLCGVGGALLFSLSSLFPAVAGVTSASVVIGASGCVLGCVAACMMVFPREQIGLFLIPISFTVFALGAVYIGLDVLNVLVGGNNAGGALAHLGGAATGYVLVKRAGWLRWADTVSVPDVKGAIQEKQRQRASMREALHEQEVDRILAKVKDHGLAALSESEKRVLNADTERKRQGR